MMPKEVLLKRVYIIIIVLISILFLYSDISELKLNSKRLGYTALKKEHELLQKHPEYRNFIFRPSSRSLIENTKN